MTKISDFPVYGIVGDINGKPMAFGCENLFCLLIELEYVNALNTVKNFIGIARAQELPGENISDQIKIVKLFNSSEIQSFRQLYNWNSENECLGYVQIKFTQDKLSGEPDINKIKFNAWEEYIKLT